MFSLGATYLLYNFILITCPLLCYFSLSRGKRSGVYLAYIILFVLSAIRYDIGFDYANYYGIFMDKANNFSYHNTFSWTDLLDLEPIAFFFCYLFKWSEEASLYIFATYSFFTLLLLYKTFEHYKIHTIGLLLYIGSWTLCQSWDWVRQALSLSLFLYSIQYIENKTFWKFFLCVIVAALSHYSALILLLVYPVSKITIPKSILISSIVVFTILSIFGVFETTRSFLFSVIPYYAQTYAGTEYESAASDHTSISMLLTICIYLVFLITTEEEYKFLQFPFALGCLLYIVASGNLNINRIAWYFTSLQLIIVPLSIKEIPPKSVKLTILTLSFILLFFIFNYLDIGYTVRGCTPYQTIFSDECKYQEFRNPDPIIWVK